MTLWEWFKHSFFWWVWKPRRRFMLWLSNHVPEPLETRILDWLYSDDMMVMFVGEENDADQDTVS